jgi:hypothetical protein
MDDGDMDDDDEDFGDGVGDLPSPPEMKKELIQAIHDEAKEFWELRA